MQSFAERSGGRRQAGANIGVPDAPLRGGERSSRDTRSKRTYRIRLPSSASDDAPTTKLCGILRDRC